MATNTNGGTTVSFSNTPQAQDDTFNILEHAAGSVLILDVLGNDLGGAAKTLYSIDNGPSANVVGTKTPAPADLLNKDAAYASQADALAAGGTSDTSLKGAKIWIGTDGKVHYDTSMFAARIQGLGAGETFTDSFTYAIKLANGTLSWATANIVIQGQNDGPSLLAGSSATGAFGELAGQTGSSAMDGVSGKILFGDLDLNDTHAVSQSGPSFAWSGGALSASQIAALTSFSALAVTTTDSTGSGTGSVTWNYSALDKTFDFLAAGQTLTITYNVKIDDGHGGTVVQPITLTITGTNDAPVVTALTASATEDGAVSKVDALSNASDVDDGTTLSVVNVPASLPAGVVYDALTHSFTLDPSDAAYQHLAANQTTTVVVNYGVSDGTATTAQSVTWTITGTNDAPVVTALTASATEDGAVSKVDALSNASDVDDGTTLSVVNVPASLPAGVVYDALTHSFTLDPSDAAYQHLAANQTTTVVVNYGVSDGTATTAQSVTWTITGTNDAPVVTALTASATEDGAVSKVDALSNASDVDDGTTLSVVNVPASLPAGVVYDALTHSFTLDPSDAAYQHLAANQTTTVVVNYGVSDGTATTAQSVTWTITGTNDAPVVTALTASATEDGAVSKVDALSNASDVDDGTTLSVVNVPASLPAGVVYDALTHSFTLDPSDAAYQHLAANQTTTVVVNYGVSDGTATTAQSVTWTITGTNDAPVVTALTASATEDGAVSKVDALSNASDVDDGTTLSVVNVPASLPAGVVYDALTHSFTLDPSDAAYQHLAANQTTTVVVNYGVSDGTATTAQSVTWTITGTNDAPVVTALTASATEDGAVSKVDALSNASDVDDGTTLSVVNVPASLPAGVVYDALTHSFTLDPSDAAYQHLAANQTTTVVVNYGVSDGTATTAQSVTWTITGTNDAPVVTALTASATEDGAVSKVDALSNASDVDDGTTLSVVNVPASLPAGVVYDALTHSFTLDPSDAAYQHLAANQTTTVVVNYGVSDGTATTAQSVTWTITGTNDAPVVTALTASATEDGAVSKVDALSNASDVDDGTTLSVVNVPASLPAGVVYDALTHSFTLDPSDAAYQHLAANQTTTVVVNYGVSDGTATTAQSVTWTITGTNDAPVVTALTASATEDGAVSKVDALSNASDVDDGTTLSVVNVPASLPAGVVYDALTHSFTLDPSDAAYQHLAANQTTTVVVNYGVSDGTATTAQSVTWTITGTNDAPVVTALTASATEDGAVSKVDALSNASDVDDGTTLSVVNVPASLPAGVVYDALTHSFTLDPSDAAYQHLAANQTTTVVVNYGVSDGTATTAQSVTWTITGTNDAPVVTALTASATEDGAVSKVDALSNASDVDDGTTLSVVNVPASLPAGVVYDALTHSFTLDPSDAAYQHLAANQTTTVVVNYGVSDGTATTAQSVTWTITGTNDAPVVTALTASATEDGAVSKVDALSNASDVDDGTTLSVVNVPASLPAGVVYDALTHSFTLDPSDAAYQHLAANQTTTVVVNYGVSDGTATTAQSVTWTITGTNDAPVVTALTASATEDGAVSKVDALSNASDVDDGTTLSVVNVPASLPAGVVYDALTHSFTLDPSDAAYQHLAANQTTTVVVNYGVSDGTATTAQSVTWTITGTNDAPVVTALTASATEDGAVSKVDALSNASDVDDGTTLSVVNVPASLPAGVVYDALTHSFTLDPSDAAYQHLAANQTTTVVVNYGVSDGTATTAQSVTWTITGTNDAPVVTALTASATEDGAVSKVDALSNASDVDDGTTLSVVNVPASLPAGVVYDALTHSFTLDPSDAAYQHLAANQTTTVVVNYGVSDGTATTAQSVTWTITGTNDAPVVTAGNVTLAGITAAQTNTAGVTVASLLGASVSDADDSALQGIAVTGQIASNGHWEFSTNAGSTWSSFGSYSAASALLLASNDLVRFVPNGSNASTDTFNYKAWDQTTGAHSSVVDASTGGGMTAFSTQQNTASITVTSVADTTPPTVTVSAATTSVKAGQTDAITFTFSEAVTGFDLADVKVISGALSNLAQVDATHYTATFTPSAANAFSGSVQVLASGSGGASWADIAGNAGTQSNTVTLAGDTLRPSVILSATPRSGAGNYDVKFAFSEGVTGFDNNDVSVVGATLGAITQDLVTDPTGKTYTAQLQVSGSSGSKGTVTVLASGTGASSWTDGSGNGGQASLTLSATKPAGVAGSPINLGLTSPMSGDHAVTAIIANVPEDWTFSDGTRNADGTWTVSTNDIASLTVTTPARYTGAVVLNVTETWADANGEIHTAIVANNVEAYAPGTPIFAWSGDDNLTGSAQADTFVFADPIGADNLFKFEVAQDKIDLIGFSGFASFADVQAHLANDANGDAVLTLGAGESIRFDHVHAGDLTSANFLFDQKPVVTNAGTMTLADGAMLPLSGAVHNTGVIELASAGAQTLLQLIEHGVTLDGGGHVTLSDSDGNVITGTGAGITLTNVDNVISGAGQLGAGALSLINQGTINASGSHVLVIDTGANVVENVGVLAATSSGGLIINSGLNNTGALEAHNSSITITGDVTGAGAVILDGGAAGVGSSLELKGAAASVVDVSHGDDILQLDASLKFTGAVTGFGVGDTLDLRDVTFSATTTVAYAANAAGDGGALTVSDGVHAATIHLVGVYDAAAFALATDVAGGTAVHYDPQHLNLIV